MHEVEVNVQLKNGAMMNIRTKGLAKPVLVELINMMQQLSEQAETLTPGAASYLTTGIIPIANGTVDNLDYRQDDKIRDATITTQELTQLQQDQKKYQQLLKMLEHGLGQSEISAIVKGAKTSNG